MGLQQMQLAAEKVEKIKAKLKDPEGKQKAEVTRLIAMEKSRN